MIITALYIVVMAGTLVSLTLYAIACLHFALMMPAEQPIVARLMRASEELTKVTLISLYLRTKWRLAALSDSRMAICVVSLFGVVFGLGSLIRMLT